MDIKIPDEDQAIQILTGLSRKYEPLVNTFKCGSGKDTLILNNVVSAAYSKEIELREKGSLGKPKSNAEGLYAWDRGRSDKRDNNSSRGRSKAKGRNYSKYKSSKNNKVCFICGKEGEIVPIRESSKVLALARLMLHQLRDQKLNLWYLLLVFISHQTRRFFYLKEVSGGKVLMGNNTFSKIECVGKIRIKRPNGSIVILTDVKFMPTMGRKMISYRCFDKSGFTYEGGDYRVKFYKDGAEVLTGKYADGLYYLEGTVLEGESNSAVPKVSVTKKWHFRLGHISQKGLDLLVKEGYLEAKDIDTLWFSEDRKGSQTKLQERETYFKRSS